MFIAFYSGIINKINRDNILNEDDLKNNLILACNSVPNTDIEIRDKNRVRSKCFIIKFFIS